MLKQCGWQRKIRSAKERVRQRNRERGQRKIESGEEAKNSTQVYFCLLTTFFCAEPAGTPSLSPEPGQLRAAGAKASPRKRVVCSSDSSEGEQPVAHSRRSSRLMSRRKLTLEERLSAARAPLSAVQNDFSDNYAVSLDEEEDFFVEDEEEEIQDENIKCICGASSNHGYLGLWVQCGNELCHM